MNIDALADEEIEFVEFCMAAEPDMQCVVMLMAHAMKRNDQRLFDGLLALAHMDRCDSVEDEIDDPDMTIVERLTAVCPKDERVWWGRCLLLIQIAGDRARRDALMGLILRRTAS